MHTGLTPWVNLYHQHFGRPRHRKCCISKSILNTLPPIRTHFLSSLISWTRRETSHRQKLKKPYLPTSFAFQSCEWWQITSVEEIGLLWPKALPFCLTKMLVAEGHSISCPSSLWDCTWKIRLLPFFSQDTEGPAISCYQFPNDWVIQIVPGN